MKTTIDLPEELLYQAKQTALKHRTTLKALIAEGLAKSIVTLNKEREDHTIDILNSAHKDQGLWESIDCDDYVEELRKGWN